MSDNKLLSIKNIIILTKPSKIKVKRNNKMIMNGKIKNAMVALLLVTAPAVTHARE